MTVGLRVKVTHKISAVSVCQPVIAGCTACFLTLKLALSSISS